MKYHGGNKASAAIGRNEPARRTCASAVAIRWLAPMLLLAAGGSAHALVIGVTEGVTYRASDSEIEARFAPIAEVLSKTLKQPVTIKVLSSYGSAREARPWSSPIRIPAARPAPSLGRNPSSNG